MRDRFDEYKEQMDRIGLSQDSKKALVKTLTEHGPEQEARRSVRPLRTALIAAAACLLLVGTALAASPELRGMLVEALGAFRPYAREVNAQVYEFNGFEFKVVSALSDGSIVRVYVEVRDLERDRLGYGDIWVDGRLYQSLTKTVDGKEVAVGFSIASRCVSYDEESGVALLEFSHWGNFSDDLDETRLWIYGVGSKDSGEPQPEDYWVVGVPVERLEIVFDLETLPSVIYEMDPEQWTGFPATQVKVSPLGITTVTYGMEYDASGRLPPGWMDGLALRAVLADGTELELGETFGCGDLGIMGEAVYFDVDCWDFEEPIDPEQVVGFYLENANPNSWRSWKGITYVENAYPDGVYIPLK